MSSYERIGLHSVNSIEKSQEQIFLIEKNQL